MPEGKETAEELHALLERFKQRLASPEFRKKAPAHVVQQQEEKVADLTRRLKATEASGARQERPAAGTLTVGMPPKEKTRAVKEAWSSFNLPTFVWPERADRQQEMWNKGANACDLAPLYEIITAKKLLDGILEGKEGIGRQPLSGFTYDAARIPLSSDELDVIADNDQVVHMGSGVWHLSTGNDPDFPWVLHSNEERAFAAADREYRESLESDKRETVASLRSYLASKSFEAALALLSCSVGDAGRSQREAYHA